MTSNRLTLALWVAILLVASVFLASKLRIDDDLTVFLPSDGTPLQDLLFTRLRDGPAARLVLFGFEDGMLADRVAASQEAVMLLADRDDLALASNGRQAMSPTAFGRLFAYRYLLAEPQGMDRASLTEALALRARQLKSPFAKIYEQEAARDPTGLFRALLVSWRDGTKPVARANGVWVSPDRSRSLLLLEITSTSDMPKRQMATVLELEAILDQVAARHGVTTVMAGSPVSSVRAQALVRQEMAIGTIVAVSMVIVFLFWVYRSFWALALGALPIATGILIGLTATLLGFGSVHRITLAFGVTLLGVAIDYPLHVFSHARGDEPLAATARRIASPMLLGAATTIAAFMVLGTGGFAGLAQLATFIAAGLTAAVVTALWLVPALAGDARLFGGAKLVLGGAWAPPFWLRPLFLALSATALGLLLVQGDGLWERNLSALSPVPKSIRVLDGDLRADLGAPDLRYLFLISGDDAEAMLQTSEALEARLADLKERGAIGGFDAIHRYLPSKATQLARRAALPTRQQLEADLAAAANGHDFDPGLFTPFVDAVEASRKLPPLAPDDGGFQVFEGTPLWPKLTSLMTEQDGRWYGFVPLSAVQDLAALRATAASLDGVDYIDLKEISADSITAFRNQALIRLAAGLALISALLLLVRRDVVTTLRILLAMASALAITAAVLSLLGEKFSLFHILASLVVIGVGLDYGLFFSWKADLAEERRRSFHGIAICAISTSIVFGLLACSSIAVLRVIGLTVALGTCLTFASCYLLVALPARNLLEGR